MEDVSRVAATLLASPNGPSEDFPLVTETLTMRALGRSIRDVPITAWLDAPNL